MIPRYVPGIVPRLAQAFCLVLACLVTLGLSASGARATMAFNLGDRPLYLMGYAKMNLALGVGDKDFNSQQQLNSAAYTFLVESQYSPTPDLKLFASGMLAGDLIYDMLSDDDKWDKKGFSDSRSRLAHDTDFEEVLHEAHLTWSRGNFFTRIGKQIVVWGETDGFRLMDQINPLDQRRGITDVEFENTVLPIWLVRTEYFLNPQSSWLEDLGFEFIFNPNASFQPNKPIVPGNDVAGVWAPKVIAQLPMGEARLGSLNTDIEGFDDWDSDAFEYGFRVKALIKGAMLTFNYFYGIDNSYAAINLPLPPDVEISPYDGTVILHPYQRGYYPRFRIAGFTFTQSLDSLYVSSLGGVAPVLRFEGFYGFGNTFTTTLSPGLDRFETHDEIRYAIGLDWKVKIDFLNPKAYFTISPQFYHRRIMDFPQDYELISAAQILEKDNFQTSLMISTTYLHNKLQPSFFWLWDITTRSYFVRPQLVFEMDDTWKLTLGAIFLAGSEKGKGYQPLEDKDHVYLAVTYRF